MLGLILEEHEYVSTAVALASGYQEQLLPTYLLEKAKLDLSKLVIKWVAVKDAKTGKIFYRKYWVDPAIKDDTEALKKKAIKGKNADNEEFLEHFDHSHDHDHGDHVEVEHDGETKQGIVTDFAMYHSKKGKGQMKYVKVTHADGTFTTHKQEGVKLLKKGHHAAAETAPKAEPVAAPKAAPAADKPAKTAEASPVDGPEKFVKKLGGSTGAVLVEINGVKYVKKKGLNAAHVKSEYEANQLYKAFGVAVPEAHFKDNTLYLKYLEDSDELLEAMAFDNDGSLTKQIKDGFAADALLGNWDVAGAEYDNILVKDGVGYRIDTGGCLEYRAQGELKSTLGKNMETDISDYVTLLDAKKNENSANIFNGVTRPEILEQLEKIDLTKIPDTVSAKTKALIQKRYLLLHQELHNKYGGPKLIAKHKGAWDSYSGQYYDAKSWSSDKDVHHFYDVVEQTIKFNEEDAAQLENDHRYGTEAKAEAGIKSFHSSKSGYRLEQARKTVKEFHDLGLTYREICAIVDYTGGNSGTINGALARKVNSVAGNVNFGNFHSDSHSVHGKKAKFNEPEAPQFAMNAGNQSFYSDLVDAAKSINHHHAKGNPQDYNKQKVEQVKNNLEKIAYMEQDAADAPESYGNGEKAMLDHYKALSEQVLAAVSKGEKTPIVEKFDPTPHLAPALEKHKADVKAKKAAFDAAAQASGTVKATADVVKVKSKLSEYNDHEDRKYLAVAKLMASGLRKLEIAKPEHADIVYRGLRFNNTAHETFNSEHNLGDTVAWQRMTSTGQNNTLGFYTNADVRCDIKNFKGNYVETITQVESENEIIAKPFSVFKVLEKKENVSSNWKTHTHYVMEHLG